MSRGTKIKVAIPASWAARAEWVKKSEEGHEIVPLAILDDGDFDIILGERCQGFRLEDVSVGWLNVVFASAARLKRQRQKEAKSGR